MHIIFRYLYIYINTYINIYLDWPEPGLCRLPAGRWSTPSSARLDLNGVSKSVKVLFVGKEAVVVLALNILK